MNNTNEPKLTPRGDWVWTNSSLLYNLATIQDIALEELSEALSRNLLNLDKNT